MEQLLHLIELQYGYLIQIAGMDKQLWGSESHYGLIGFTC